VLCARSEDKLAAQKRDLLKLLAPGAAPSRLSAMWESRRCRSLIFETIRKNFRRLDILVNNAAYMAQWAYMRMSIWNEMMADAIRITNPEPAACVLCYRP